MDELRIIGKSSIVMVGEIYELLGRKIMEKKWFLQRIFLVST
jgi:hypothetical protein